MEEAQRASFLAKVNNGDKEAIKQYITEVFGNEAGIAIKIAQCESGLRVDAVGDLHLDNGTNPSFGIFQIRYFNGARGSKEQLLTATYNIEQARRMQLRQGWGIWSCYKKI